MPRTGPGWDSKLRHACIRALRNALGAPAAVNTGYGVAPRL